VGLKVPVTAALAVTVVNPRQIRDVAKAVGQLAKTDAIDEPDALTTVFAPAGTTVEELVQDVGSRWRVEMGVGEAKGPVGQDQDEVRSWHGWYRHSTVAPVAHAVLAAIRVTGQDINAAGLWHPPHPVCSVYVEPWAHAELTVAEVPRLVHSLLGGRRSAWDVVLHWSCWWSRSGLVDT
jgi:hypothetical protein